MTFVFQYGSNCNAGRLNSPSRLNGHAEDLGRAQTIEDFDIAFDVYSQTNGCAAPDLVRFAGRKAWCVLYEIPGDFIDGRRADGQKTLEQIEGHRYKQEPIRAIDKDGNVQGAVTFLVRETERCPGLAASAAYVSWIVRGLLDHGVPEEYIAHVIEVAIETNQRAGEFAAEQIRLIKGL
jgi:hypothetical protein